VFADVILPLSLPGALTYGVPADMHDALKPGMRVEVALGRNKQYAGIVERLHYEKPDNWQVKPIRSVLDTQPIVTEQQLAFWRWIAQYYMAAPGEVMQAALPAHLKMAGETRLEWAGDDTIEYEWSDAALRAAVALKIRKEITIGELRTITGAHAFAAALNELLEKDAVIINEALETDYRPRREKVVKLAAAYSEEPQLMALFDQLMRAPKQLQLLMAYIELNQKNHGMVKQADLLERASASAAQLKALTEKGIMVVHERNTDRLPPAGPADAAPVVLTPAQQTAYDAMSTALDAGKVTVLHGVTGSGKTLLYVKKIQECIATGAQALLLLPEIALTTQLVRRLQAHFGGDLGVYHSHFSNNERVEIWEKVQRGTYRVVVGPRSALWLPYQQTGLIIVDEEHDSSYKQKDPAPRFHARDAAIYMAAMTGAQIVLGSATPSVETLYHAHMGRYAIVPLRERYMGVALPTIQLCDARKLIATADGPALITPELQAEIKKALQHQRQVILFQNRRGYVPFMLCTSCGWTPRCRNCDVTLTYHKSTDKLHCHYCGFRSAVVHVCPACGSEQLTGKTFGTQKIEEEAQRIFPDARVARMDADSMKGRHAIADLMDKLEKRKIDILAGTQMVVKGLDFEGVALVGVINADNLLSFPDFRVNERAFQLLEQVSGRAGRADGQGLVLIQVCKTDHPVLKWVKDHDIASFYRYEIKHREQFFYPPFSRLIRIIFRHADEGRTAQAAQMMADALQTVPGIGVQGPGAAIVPRVRNQYIYEIWIKCPRDTRIGDSVKTFLKEQRRHIGSQRGNANVQIIFDVDPA
jgi:primosomal protein N' (replication factor Y)